MLRVASVLSESVVDGIGIRVVVFFQGCKHLCKGCHNPALLPIEGGTEYLVEELAEKILKETTMLHNGVTFSGGDPLLQAEEVDLLIKHLRSKRPNINIWVYTGYKYEEIIDWNVLKGIDVLIDGRFEEDKKDYNLRFKGSSNQRIIDVQASIKTASIVEYKLPD